MNRRQVARLHAVQDRGIGIRLRDVDRLALADVEILPVDDHVRRRLVDLRVRSVVRDAARAGRDRAALNRIRMAGRNQRNQYGERLQHTLACAPRIQFQGLL
ncbi:hypothetical protein [Burkholderia territorii]|uniref:hypothetical protein n=1 Tax=Burkholderia territorii TaxID=1503055 RepID=UPI001E317FE8|nr:hypothetical protein [Burkholderia territorii]